MSKYQALSTHSGQNPLILSGSPGESSIDCFAIAYTRCAGQPALPSIQPGREPRGHPGTWGRWWLHTVLSTCPYPCAASQPVTSPAGPSAPGAQHTHVPCSFPLLLGHTKAPRSCPTQGTRWGKTLLLEALCSHRDPGCSVHAKNCRELPKGCKVPAKTQALLSLPWPRPTNHNSSVGAGWDTSSHGGQVASRANTEAQDAFSRVPLPMAEAVVKTHEEGWNIDLCATDGRESQLAAGQDRDSTGRRCCPSPRCHTATKVSWCTGTWGT